MEPSMGGKPPPKSGAATTLVIALALGLAFLLKAAASLAAGANGVGRFADDALYYLIIARNFAQTGVPTFDGVNATNGFHPLWMAMIAAMYRLLGTDAGLFLQIYAFRTLETLTLGFALAACVAAFHRLRTRTPLAWGFVGAALVMLVPVFTLFEQGMESTLAAGLAMAVLYALIDRRPLLLAASMPLLFLARLDTLVFVIAPLAVAWVLRAPREWKWKPLAPLAVVVALYLGTNHLLLGEATPISGQIKSSFPRVTLHLDFLWDAWEVAPLAGWGSLYATPNLLAASVALLLLAIVCVAYRREPWARTTGLVLVIVALLIANLVLFQRWNKGVEPRYLALPYVLLGFAAFTVLGALARNRPMVPLSATLLLAAACAAGTVERLRVEKGQRIDRRTHYEVMGKTRPGERFAGTDVGGFSFWLERPFVNLDGLVNTRQLQRAIRDRRLGAYLREMDVRYLVLAFWDSEQKLVSRPTDRMYRSRIFPAGVNGPDYDHYDFTLYSYLYDTDSEPVRLCPAQEIFRERIGRDGTANAAIVIYKLDAPCGPQAARTGETPR
jgi:hypothetical protein